jgi:hypothetical protein
MILSLAPILSLHASNPYPEGQGKPLFVKALSVTCAVLFPRC